MGLFTTIKRKFTKPRKPSKPISASPPARRAKPAPTAQKSAPASTPSTSPHANNAGSSNITSRPANNTNMVRSSGGRGSGQSSTPPTSPHANNTGSANITSRPPSETEIKRSSLTDDVDRHWDAEKAYKAGVVAAEDVEVSDFSKKAHTKTKEMADNIRGAAPFVGAMYGGVKGKAAQYPIRSSAVLVETAGMVPGGVEIIAQKPDVIKPAVEFGLYQSTVGTAKAFKEDPLQVTSDLLTVGLITHGVAKGGGALYGRAAQVGSKVKANVNIKTQMMHNERTLVQMRNRDPFQPPGKIQTKTSDLLFDLEVQKLRTKAPVVDLKNSVKNTVQDYRTKSFENMERFAGDDKGQLLLLKPEVKPVSQIKPRTHSEVNDVFQTLDAQMKTRSNQIPSMQDQLLNNNIRSSKSAVKPVTNSMTTPSLGSMLGVGLNVRPMFEASTGIMSDQQTGVQPMQAQKPAVAQRQAHSFLTSQMQQPASKEAIPSPVLNLFGEEPMMPKVQTITPPHAKQTGAPVDSTDILTGSRKKRHTVQDPLDFLMG